jgi:hypothetical protein
MNRIELRVICDSLNDEQGKGGQAKLIPMLGWYPTTLRRKLKSRSRVTQPDELAITGALGRVPSALPLERL